MTIRPTTIETELGGSIDITKNNGDVHLGVWDACSDNVFLLLSPDEARELAHALLAAAN